jgi:hypothetical protein
VTGGDIDAAWDRADVGEEAVGGSVATPDQDIVENLGSAVGLTYEDNEPLHTTDKLKSRDRRRWELNPASAEDFQERNRATSISSGVKSKRRLQDKTASKKRPRSG